MFCFLSHWYTSRLSHHSGVRSAMKFLYFTHLSHQCKTFFPKVLKFTLPLRQESRDTKFHFLEKIRHATAKIFISRFSRFGQRWHNLINFNHICHMSGLYRSMACRLAPTKSTNHQRHPWSHQPHGRIAHQKWGLLDGERGEVWSDMISFVLMYDNVIFWTIGQFATKKCKGSRKQRWQEINKVMYRVFWMFGCIITPRRVENETW